MHRDGKSLQNSESEKLAHKIGAKNAQNHAKLAKKLRVRCVHLFPSLNIAFQCNYCKFKLSWVYSK